MMLDEKQLQQLLKLKRFEQPPPGYFERALEEFHRRQRAKSCAGRRSRFGSKECRPASEISVCRRQPTRAPLESSRWWPLFWEPESGRRKQ